MKNDKSKSDHMVVPPDEGIVVQEPDCHIDDGPGLQSDSFDLEGADEVSHDEGNGGVEAH